jgi:DNA-binding response OmpR family regulator
MPSTQFRIVMIGDNSWLAYLIERYAGRSGHPFTALQAIPPAEEIGASRPVAVVFPTVESLEAAQPLIAGLASWDVPVLVCSSIADELRARELGADHCLVHPLTYEGFLAALAAASRLSARPLGTRR